MRLLIKNVLFLSKIQAVTEDLNNFAKSIEVLHDQASQLPEPGRSSQDVRDRLATIGRRYHELQDLAKLRKQRLLDALSLYKLFNDADSVEAWINENEKLLASLRPGDDLEEVEIMKHRFDTLDGDMNNQANKVAVVNQLARQLLHVEHPNSDQILQRQNKLNQR